MKDICNYVEKVMKKHHLEPVDYEREYKVLFAKKIDVGGYSSMVSEDGLTTAAENSANFSNTSSSLDDTIEFVK